MNSTIEDTILRELKSTVSIPVYAIVIVGAIICILLCVIGCFCCCKKTAEPKAPAQQLDPQPLAESLLRQTRVRKPRFIVGQSSSV
jgi:hypothetical protein